MATELEQLQAGIAALEAQRAVLGDAVANAALAPLRAKLAALAATQPATEPQTLKQVTILFLDVVGSTTLSNRLDPEDIHAVLDGALARCTAIVEAHHGKVLQYAGDSLLAVFGADTAREDDPERAVRCGLALLAEGRALSDEIHRRHRHEDFNVRVGLHTGGVLLGGGVDAEGSIRGIAVSVAARMEQTAPPGALRISRDTYRHVRGLFEVQAQAPLTVKGLEEPLATYLVLRAKPHAFRVAARGVEGVDTRLIGRDTELGQLRGAFESLCRERELIAVTVVGDAGVGKSRLLDEFERWSATRPERFTTFKGRATPQTQTQPYGLLRDIFARWLQPADGDAMQIARQSIEQAVVPLFAADESEAALGHAHLLGHLIGMDFNDSKHIQGIRDDGRQIRERGFHAAAQTLRRVAARGDASIVVLLEDLHWADDASLDFLAYLNRVNRDVPMLVVALTRPTLFERTTHWPGSANARRIELCPLDEGDSLRLARELLKKLPEIPAALQSLITGGAEGNPFYMEELVNMLVDQGAIEVTPERWIFHHDKLLATRVPPTLTGVLQSRLDGLPADERLTLQEASVIGFVFWDQALAVIDPQAGQSLPGLVQRGLTLPHLDARLAGMREFIFRHHILHQVTYGTLLKKLRLDMHGKVAAWLADLADARANDLLGTTAEHYEKAGNQERAAEFYARAAEHAIARYAHEAALNYVARAIALADEAARSQTGDASDRPLRLRWRMLEVREQIHDLEGKRDEQRADIESMQHVAEALNDDRCRGVAAYRRSRFAMRTANYRGQEEFARKAIELARRAGDTTLQLRAKVALAFALNYLGDGVTAEALATEGVADSRALGLRALESHFLNALSLIASVREDTATAIELGRQQLPIDRELGNPRDEAITLGNLGSSLLTMGAHTEARQHLESGLRLSRTIGDREGEFVPLFNLSVLARREGDFAQALQHARLALDAATAVQNPPLEVLALCVQGDAELALGHHAAAAAAFQRAHDIALVLANDGLAMAAGMQQDAIAGQARVSLSQGDLDRAMSLVERVLTQLELSDALTSGEDPQILLITCHRVLARAGDPRAAATLGNAHAILQARAATINDAALRHSFLNNVLEHREILAAWESHRAAAANRERPGARHSAADGSD
jgi:class 3 adenylate cyclase/tetratricopeptide (TPR) repeat protein